MAWKFPPPFAGLGSYGGMERLHYLLERVWERPDEELSIHFLKVGQRPPLQIFL